MFKHILVPTDGSELSGNAARIAVRLAASLGARLTALHVVPPYSFPISDGTVVYAEIFTPEEYKESTEKYARAILGAIQAEAKSAGVECAALAVTSPAPWDAIIKAAQSQKCDLVVMATHGRKGIAGVLLGSEANKVLTHSTIPVLACR